MSTNATPEQEVTDDESPGGLPTEPPITGPHVGYDRRGDFVTTYYRWECCGVWSVDESLPEEGCWNCGVGGYGEGRREAVTGQSVDN